MTDLSEIHISNNFHELTDGWISAAERRVVFLNQLSEISRNTLNLPNEEYEKFIHLLSLAVIPTLLHDGEAYCQSLKKLISEENVDVTNVFSVTEELISEVKVYKPEVGDFLNRTNKFKKITKIKLGGDNFDVVYKIKKTKIGLFYLNRLKKFKSVRLSVEWLWRNVYPFYVSSMLSVNYRHSKRWRPIIKLNDYLLREKLDFVLLADSKFVETPEPQVYPALCQDNLVSPHDQYEFPPLYIATIKNAEINGGTNFILKDDGAICHDLFQVEADYTSEELHGRNIINSDGHKTRWLLSDRFPETISEGAAFIDACAPNYAHWLSEVLPRVTIFCAQENYKKVPLLINEGLHKNIMQSLHVIAGEDREIITMPIGRASNIGKLHVTSVAGYVPFERRSKDDQYYSHGKFSSVAFSLMREKIFSFIDRLPPQNCPENIYIRRNSGVRRLKNNDEIESYLSSRGYVIVEPEKLSFIQQVQIFSQAKNIIGTSGAAIANMIFSSSSAQIIILIGDYVETSYWYWQNMACAAGLRIKYGLGTVEDSQNSGVHSDFHFQINNFSEMEV